MANYDFAGLSIVDSLRAFFTLMHIPSSSAGIKVREEWCCGDEFGWLGIAAKLHWSCSLSVHPSPIYFHPLSFPVLQFSLRWSCSRSPVAVLSSPALSAPPRLFSNPPSVIPPFISCTLNSHHPPWQTILHAVAEAYVEQNSGGVDDVALDAEAVYLVYYSVLMINTDIHNITVKNKMPRDRFIDRFAPLFFFFFFFFFFLVVVVVWTGYGLFPSDRSSFMAVPIFTPALAPDLQYALVL